MLLKKTTSNLENEILELMERMKMMKDGAKKLIMKWIFWKE